MSIEINQLTKSFKDTNVLNDITMTIKDNEILGLIGPSGAGKTTLIRIITGSLKADQGYVTMKGINVPNKELYKQFGFMPQGEALYSDLSGVDNLRFYGRLYGIEKKALEARCQELLKLMNLENHQHKLVDKYSGGMKKRLSLCVAMLHNPDYLILDEPTVGIDPALRVRIWDKFDELFSQGKTIIVSTHVMDEADRCHRCALLKNGKVLKVDTVEKLKSQTKNGNIESLFLTEEVK